MKTNRMLAGVMMLVLLVGALCGCVEVKTTDDVDTTRPYVVCTAFPQYDFIKNIAFDGVNLEMLVPDGMDTHNFGLKDISVSKLDRLQKADLLVSVGGESDEKLVEELREVLGDNVRIVSLLSLVDDPLLNESQGYHSQDDGHDHHDEEPDEHVWTSPKRVLELVGGLADVLGEIDAENKEQYAAGADAYKKQISALDGKLQALTQNAPHDTLIFADRYPFRYLCKDYGLSAEAAFSGCSSEVEPSLAVLDALYERAKELSLPAILYMEGSNSQYAENIAAKIGGRALMLHSCHVLTSEEMKDQNYLSLMEQNIAVLEIALGVK